jgi:hypothetical protein
MSDKKKTQQKPPKPEGNGNTNSKSDPATKPFLVTEDFDLDKLRVRGRTSAAAPPADTGTVRVEKPNRMRFFYVPPTGREILYIVPADEKRKAHLAVPAVAEQFPQFCRAALIVPYASNQANWFLWAILLEDRAGRISDYSESAMQRVQEANGLWVRFEADTDNRSYRLYVAGQQPEPPTLPPGGIEALIRRAFEDRIITSDKHPVIQELLGEKK